MLEKKGFNWIRTYTTRPQREGEPDDSYRFIDEETFQDMIEHGKFSEWKDYEPSTPDWRIWRYGSPKLDKAGRKDFIILTPQGYLDIKNQLPENSYCVYIYANDKDILKRLKKRGDDWDESQRRMKADNQDFMKAYDIADHIFYNHEETDLNELVTAVARFAETGPLKPNESYAEKSGNNYGKTRRNN